MPLQKEEDGPLLGQSRDAARLSGASSSGRDSPYSSYSESEEEGSSILPNSRGSSLSAQDASAGNGGGEGAAELRGDVNEPPLHLKALTFFTYFCSIFAVSAPPALYPA